MHTPNAHAHPTTRNFTGSIRICDLRCVDASPHSGRIGHTSPCRDHIPNLRRPHGRVVLAAVGAPSALPLDAVNLGLDLKKDQALLGALTSWADRVTLRLPPLRARLTACSR